VCEEEVDFVSIIFVYADSLYPLCMLLPLPVRSLLSLERERERERETSSGTVMNICTMYSIIPVRYPVSIKAIHSELRVMVSVCYARSSQPMLCTVVGLRVLPEGGIFAWTMQWNDRPLHRIYFGAGFLCVSFRTGGAISLPVGRW
jgi:hypothetical protein